MAEMTAVDSAEWKGSQKVVWKVLLSDVSMAARKDNCWVHEKVAMMVHETVGMKEFSWVEEKVGMTESWRAEKTVLEEADLLVEVMAAL